MAKARIVTARLKFSPRKAGRDMGEGQLADRLARSLEFTDGLDVLTVADRGDMLRHGVAAIKALRRLTRELDWATDQLDIEQALCANSVSRARDHAAAVLAAIRAAEGREG